MSSSVTRLYEYSAAAAVELPLQPAVAFPSSLHASDGASAVIALDCAAALGNCAFPATSPNLLASFVRLQPGQPLATQPHCCSSQLFYVIRGSGRSSGCSSGEISWGAGDAFTLPGSEGALTHTASEPAAFYWVHDEPLLRYLGVVAAPVPRFAPALYTDAVLRARVDEIRHDAAAAGRNRMGVLLGHEATDAETKTITPILWALLNTLPAHTAQPPHRHNSVALDLCVAAPPGGKVYTVMGPRLAADGWVDPEGSIKMEWLPGAVFTTPPGWWHSHVRACGASFCGAAAV